MNVRSVDGVRTISLIRPERSAVADVLILLEDLAKYDKTDCSRMAMDNLNLVACRINAEGMFNPAAVKPDAGKEVK